MKAVSTGDIHLDENNRWDETCRVMEWIEADVAAFKPDLALIGGDSAPVSVRRMTPKERNNLAEWYCDLAHYCPVVIVPGNHDGDAEDVEIFSKLRGQHMIIVLERARAYYVPTAHAVVYGVPWPSKGRLMELVKGQSVNDIGQACRDALKMVLMGAQVEFAKHPTAHHVILGHLNVTGSDVGGFSLVGQDVEVSAEDLVATGADLICLGHIHKAQEWHGRVHYPGSPRYVDHGEEGEIKGYKRFTLTKGQEPVMEFRRTEVLTPLQTIRVSYNNAFWVESACCQQGAEVRVLVDCTEAQRATIDDEQLLKTIEGHKAKSVKVEWRVRPTERVRAPAMREARSDEDRLRTYLGTIDPPVDPEVVERLVLKLATLGA